MNVSMPPRLATALLRRLAPGEEALSGNLHEDYGAGRSQGWYWWQVAGAIALAVRRDLQHQTIAALGAIAVAVSVYFALALSGAEIINDIDRHLTRHVPRWTLDSFVYQTCVSILWTLMVSWVVGVLIMALNRSHGTVALIALMWYVTLVEYPTGTLLPWLSTSDGLPVRIVVTQTALTVVKIAGLMAGSLAFPSQSGGRGNVRGARARTATWIRLAGGLNRPDRSDPVPTRPRLHADDGAVPWMQAEAPDRRERPVGN